MLVASGLGHFGQQLGIFTEGVCAEGADLVCGPRNGVFSCRPCDFAQRDIIRQLQREANSLVVGFKLNRDPAVITPQGCTGGFTLAVDARVGPCTVRTVSELILNHTGKLLAPPPELARGTLKQTPQYVARFAKEAADYLGKVRAIVKAPKDVAAPKQQPIRGGGGPAKVPGPLPDLTVDPGKPLVKKRRLGLAVGVLAGLAAVGLIGAGVYYYRTA